MCTIVVALWNIKNQAEQAKMGHHGYTCLLLDPGTFSLNLFGCNWNKIGLGIKLCCWCGKVNVGATFSALSLSDMLCHLQHFLTCLLSSLVPFSLFFAVSVLTSINYIHSWTNWSWSSISNWFGLLLIANTVGGFLIMLCLIMSRLQQTR